MTENQREIGGDFLLTWNSHKFNTFDQYQLVNTGRACLSSIAEKLSTDQKVLLPSYLCHSMYQPFEKANLELIYYPIDKELKIKTEQLHQIIAHEKVSAILIVNYFGIIDPHIDQIVQLCKNHDILIIEDITHSCLNNDLNYGDVIFGSVRKTLPILDGSIMKHNDQMTPLEINNYWYSWNYCKYLFYKLSGMSLKYLSWLKSIWYPMLLESERLLDEHTFGNHMSSISQYLLSRQNLSEIKSIREQNYKILLDKLSDYALYPNNILNFGFPIVFCDQKTRDKVRQTLIQNKVYPPIHWKLPDFLSKNTDYQESINLSQTILTIPIDQRYNSNDMERVIDLITKQLV